MASDDIQIFLRLHKTDDLVKKIDREVERLKKEAPGMEITRTDAVKVLIAKGVSR